MKWHTIILLTLLVFILLLFLPLWILSLPVPYSDSTEVVLSLDTPNWKPAIPPSSENCETSTSPHEPPCNPSLAHSQWAITHSSSYQQGSSSNPGPKVGQSFLAEHIDLSNVSITFSFSEPYYDGGIAVWGAPLTREGVVVKLDHQAFELIDSYNPQTEEDNPPEASLSITGAYNALDREGHFIIGRQRAVEVYADSVPGDRFSEIALLKRFHLPDEAFCGEGDILVGFNLTYDDHIAFVTQNGMVGVLPRQVENLTEGNLVTTSINRDNCAGEISEKVSNNIAVDENGGIFIVTSQKMYKYVWDGDAISKDWQAPYQATGNSSAIHLGAGSGATPSLMGNPEDRDRFVVITDGQELMHLVLFWRDEIPSEWTPLADGIDPRIACQVPVTFGHQESQRSFSEQSVLVRGYASVLVNNLIQKEPFIWRWLPKFLMNAFAAMEGADPENAPYGIERIDWDPETRSCEVVWANADISIPNAVPTMSQATGLIYAIGQRDGTWGLEALNFKTGESAFFIQSRQERCTFASMQQLTPLWLRWIIGPQRLLKQASCENSFYAATEIGPDGTIYSGTSLGASKFTPFGD